MFYGTSQVSARFEEDKIHRTVTAKQQQIRHFQQEVRKRVKKIQRQKEEERAKKSYLAVRFKRQSSLHVAVPSDHFLY